MATSDKNDDPIIVKKYANRRLYNTDTSTYVTLEDLTEMVKVGRDFLVYDAKSGEDITRSVLTQIIFDQEGKGQNLLPINFLRQLIRFYDDNMQKLVPSYLEYSLASFAKEQENLHEKMTKAWKINPFEMMQDQVQQNLSMFEQALSAFSPFNQSETGGADDEGPEKKTGRTKAKESEKKPSEIDELKQQLSDMQSKLESLINNN